LGEGFDLLVIDEAQEYTTEQEAALVYTVSDSSNPQTVFCGTPPTMTSAGTVFSKMRDQTLSGGMYDTGWAEWSVASQPKDIRDVDLWYETNPSMGYHLDERKIRSEIRGDELDFVIQRLGYWFKYNLKSAISEAEWNDLTLRELPKLKGKLFAGIKYGADGAHAALSIAVKTVDGFIFVESIDCQSVRNGNLWIIDFLRQADVQKVVIDGANGQQLLANEMKDFRLKPPILPTVKEVILANAAFEQGLCSQTIRHMGQPSLTQAASNCEKRNIGSNGGFGYKANREGIEIALLDSVILAYWACSEFKEKKKQTVSY
jgi:phage terminase large subunit-like protein